VISKKYIKWIKTQKCCNCGDIGCDPHHLIGFGMGSMGGKAGDELVVPLCRLCHTRFHDDPKGWNQLRWLAVTLSNAFKEGVLKVD